MMCQTQGRPGTDDSGVTKQHRINLRRDTRLATWNVRTLYKAGIFANALQEMRVLLIIEIHENHEIHEIHMTKNRNPRNPA